MESKNVKDVETKFKSLLTILHTTVCDDSMTVVSHFTFSTTSSIQNARKYTKHVKEVVENFSNGMRPAVPSSRLERKNSARLPLGPELLLSKVADVNIQGGFYGNALQAASSEGYDKIVESRTRAMDIEDPWNPLRFGDFVVNPDFL
ncbi:MAG: hypothetical protein MMC33_009216 [Icmadophila ericetorum]|nr:hypothetical protein [Icmadophila ericetorum]